jgi:hypothetical protein
MLISIQKKTSNFTTHLAFYNQTIMLTHMQDQLLSNFVKMLRDSLHASTDMLGGRDEP